MVRIWNVLSETVVETDSHSKWLGSGMDCVRVWWRETHTVSGLDLECTV